MIRRAQSGFTLIEMVIGLTLTAFIIAGLFTGLRFGATSWDSAQNKADKATNRSLVQAFVRRELAQSRPVYWTPEADEGYMAFHGEESVLHFIAPLPLHRATVGLQLFTLELEPGDKEQRLVVRYRPVNYESLDDTLSEEFESEILLDPVKGLRIEYFGITEDNSAEDPEWNSEWTERTSLPWLVKITVVGSDMPWPEQIVALRLRESDRVGTGGGRRGGGADFGPRAPGQ